MQLPSRFFPGFALLLALLWPLSADAQAPAPVTVKMSILPGLKFDQTRFAVAPGAKVTIYLENPDQMIHNLLIVAPGAREEIVSAALALGADGPAKNFIPDSKKVLWHTPALNPGEKAELTFNAPAQEGVYPYVCTSMGHGFIMYGAMYVTTKPLPPLAGDPNVPPAAPGITDNSDFSQKKLDRTVVSRTFLPDCGPAAIAVGMVGGHSYVFDAGLCYLRYAWSGGYVDNGEHWSGKGEAMGKIVGRIYHRQPGPLIHIGSATAPPAARWKGYELGPVGPTFRYTIDGHEVRETPQPMPQGTGILFNYAIESGGAPVFLTPDSKSGASFLASEGTWKNGVLQLTAEQAAKFNIIMTERPGIEPLKYWSMNDLVFTNKKMPRPGVIGRAFTPGGTDGKPKRLSSGVKLADLSKGGTLMAWVRLDALKANAPEDPENPPPVFSIGDDPAATLLTYAGVAERWTHLALTIDAQGASTYFQNGHPSAPTGAKLPTVEGDIYLGSAGEKNYLRGLLDEVRIYDRALTAREISALYTREARNLKTEE